MFLSLAGQFKCESQHAVDSAARKNRLLDGHLFIRSFVETAADVRILTFVIFPDDAEINLARFPILQRSLNSLEKTHGAQIHVLAEPAPDGNQKPPKRDVIRHAGMSDGAQEDSVERSQ